MLVYLHSNYNFPDLFRQSPGNSGKWADYQFTYEKPEQCDFVVVLNQPTEDIKIKCRKGSRILIIQEPPYKKNEYLTSYFKFFDKVISGFESTELNLNKPAMLPWHINLNYDQLKQLDKEDALTKKNKVISWVTSNSNMNPGHEPRLKLLRYLQENRFNIDMFGSGINPIEDKLSGLQPYKYTIAVENYSAADYWTEKITDAFLSRTMPVYYGCTNIEKYFPSGSFIKINIHKPQEVVEIIQDAIDQQLFEKNIDLIEEARTLILDKYQFFPAVTRLMNEELKTEQKKINCLIPYDPAGNLLNKIKNIFN